MAQREGFAEPTTEEEAEALRDFLEQGASVVVERVETLESEGGLEVVFDQPGTVAIPVPPQELIGELEQEGDRRVLLGVDFDQGTAVDSFYVEVFLHTGGELEDLIDGRAEPAATLAFFCHGGEKGDGFFCLPEANAVRFELDVTRAIRSLGAVREPLQASFVMKLTHGERTDGSLQARLVDLQVVQSIVDKG